MKRILPTLLAVVQVICLLFGCGGTPLPEQTNAPEDMQTAPERTAAAVCMGSVSHPAHRIVQLGFMEKAEELGYEGHILGLDAGSMQELYDCWLEGAKEHDIAGAVCWVGDDSAYECLKELHGMGVKTVVPYFQHTYTATKDFIDVNPCHDIGISAQYAAEFIGQALRDRGVLSGSIGLTAFGTGVTSTMDLHMFIAYMQERYPEYVILDVRFEAMDPAYDREEILDYICQNPDMVASFGATGGSAQAWAAAKKAAGREDIVTVAYDYARVNLDTLSAGGVDALIAQPFYDSGARGMELIQELLCGHVYSISESLWRQHLDAPLIYTDGEGAHNPAYYYGLHERSETRFGLGQEE